MESNHEGHHEKCPRCGVAELVHETRDMPCFYEGESTTIPTVTGDFCPDCGAVILNRDEHARYSELLGQFQLKVIRLTAYLETHRVP